MSAYLAKLLNSKHPDKQQVQDALADYFMNSDDESIIDSDSDSDTEIDSRPGPVKLQQDERPRLRLQVMKKI